MNSLQFSEINKENPLCQYRPVAGIDLGTTNSLVAIIRNKQVEILSDNQGRCLLPSVVFYKKDNCLIGYDALDIITNEQTNVISSVKRIIGRSFIDIQRYHSYLPYHIKSNIDGSLMIIANEKLVSPVSVSADILKELSYRAVTALQSKLEGVVITVPAYFDDIQRQCTKDAANLAGLNVLRLLNEPTAAAVAYGLDSKKEGIIVVYDLGGGTFDISILRLKNRIFEILAIGGDSSLGGDDFDNLLLDYICKLAGLINNSNIYIRRKLLNIAINTKITLSKMQSTIVKIDDWQGIITRNQFNELITPLIKRTLLLCFRAMKEANIENKDILDVVMVGGSTRIPLVRSLVSNFFNKILLTSIDPDKVVVTGAAIQADILAGNRINDRTLLLDVVPISLGIETIGGLVEKIIPRNTTIPIVRSQEFTTIKDNQTAIFIHVIQGEHKLVKECRSLARFSLRGIPPVPAGTVKILVTFQIDADCLLSVTAVEKSTGLKSSVKISYSNNLFR